MHQEQRSLVQSCLVTPSVPILFFGDLDAYRSSRLRVVSVGLNPSRVEFPTDDPFMRFRRAEHACPAVLSGQNYDDYLGALKRYFREQPYRRWFSSIEPILQGMASSFYEGQANTALHTDLCSPLATDPTWSNLPGGVQTRLAASGYALWERLVTELAPHVLLISIARRYLDLLTFAPDALEYWPVPFAIERARPYRVWMRRCTLPGGTSTLVAYGRAAETPWGLISRRDKGCVGKAICQELADG